jgi:hypothetical protein
MLHGGLVQSVERTPDKRETQSSNLVATAISNRVFSAPPLRTRRLCGERLVPSITAETQRSRSKRSEKPSQRFMGFSKEGFSVVGLVSHAGIDEKSFAAQRFL